MRELFMNLDLAFLDIVILFLYMMPLFLLLVVPIACMLSVFLAFLRMSTDRELIALKTGGISVFQLIQAPLLFSLVCMFLSFAVSLHGISWGMHNFRTLLLTLANTKAQVVIQPGIFNQDLLGKTLFTRNVDAQTGHLRQVIFEDKTEDGETTVTFLAPEGQLVTDEEKGEMHFTLKNGTVYQISGDAMNIMNFKTYNVQLDLSRLLSGVDIDGVRPKEMSWEMLLGIDRDPQDNSARFQNKVRVEIQKRIALPFACLVLGLFAIPVACFFEGVHRQIGVVVALVMFLIYYSILSMGISLGESGALSPAISMWMGNFIFTFMAFLGLYLVGKERSIQVLSLLRFTRTAAVNSSSGSSR